MVFMEIINLDDSGDMNSKSSPTSSPTKSDSIIQTRKRRKKIRKSIKTIRNLLNKKKIVNSESTISLCDLDATLESEENSFPKTSVNHNGNVSVNKKKKKRKKSSVVVIEDGSEDDCVEVNKNRHRKNNNVDSDVLCLSDSSVIELSDSDDVGVVTGMVETTKENKEVREVSKRRRCDVSAGDPGSSQNSTYVNENNGTCGSVTISELRKRLQTNTFQRADNSWTQAGHSTWENTSQRSNKVTRCTSRQSISYLPVESSAIRQGPRPIVIDGSNVAFGHGKEKFSAKGIEICIDYFLRRNHTDVRAFVPQFRRRHPSTIGIHLMDKLEREGHLVYTPSRQVDGKRITSYDDRYIVEYAAKTGGIVVTRDNYQDLLAENKAWSDTINFRVLQYTFVGDMIMFPHDPLGRGGPTLDKFLQF